MDAAKIPEENGGTEENSAVSCYLIYKYTRSFGYSTPPTFSSCRGLGGPEGPLRPSGDLWHSLQEQKVIKPSIINLVSKLVGVFSI